MKSPNEVREEFRKSGISISSWARANGLSPRLVMEVMTGRRKCVRGESHRIAVALGLKAGSICSPSEFKPMPRRGK